MNRCILFAKPSGRQEHFEMATLDKQESGLPYDVWLDSSGKDRLVRHNSPRIKIHVDGQFIPVIIGKDGIRALKHFPKEKEILDWVADKQDVIIKHWNRVLTDRQALNLLSEDAD